MGAILRSQATTIMLLSAAGTARGCFPTEPGNPRPALRVPPGERAAAWVRGPVCSLEPRAVTTASGHPSCWVVFKTQVTYFGVVVQVPSHVQLSATPWTAARQASLSLTIFQSLPKFMSIESVSIQPSHPLSSPSPPTFNLSQHQGLFQ